MTLRKKTLLVVGLILAGLIAVSYFVFSTVLLHGFARLEERSTEQNVSRVHEAVSYTLTSLDNTAGDWSNWDDSYGFMEDRNPEFLKTNLTDKALLELRVDMMVFVNSSGQIVADKALDGKSEGGASLLKAFEKYLSANGPLLQHDMIESAHKGLIVLPQGPILVACRPLFTSEGEGPSRGTLIVGRRLDEAEVSELAERTRLSLHVYRIDDPLMQSDIERSKGALVEGREILVQPLDADTIAGYSLLRDILGNPALLLRIDDPRTIFKQGQTTIHYLVVFLVGIGFLCCVVILVLLERLVLSRLVGLSEDLNEIGSSGDLSRRLSVRGNDELCSLTLTINGMLGGLKNAQNGLRAAYDEMEARVQKRTSELAMTNEALETEIGERRRAEEELQTAHDELERRVEERTAELVTANEQLTREIKERRHAEQALRESEERFREMADLLPVSVYEIDLEGNITFGNRAALKTFECSRDDLDNGLNAFEMIIPEEQSRVQESLLKRLNGEMMGSDEYTAIRKDGSTFPISVYASPIVRSNVAVGLRGVIVDLTDQKKMEKELLKVQKLESLGILAGGIAHDFNNIMTAVLGNISLAKMCLGPEDKVHERLEKTEKACLRAKDLTQQLLTFSKGGAPVKNTISISQLIQDSTTFALRGSNVRCELAIDPDLRPVDADEGQISQVINNIIINADQAMPVGGIVRVRAKNQVVDSAHALPLKPGKYIEISIQDQGIGIPKEHLSRIFDPYFTTKQKGNGLGLATSFSIVDKHGGYLSVESEPGIGTTFYVRLPASEEKVRKAEEKRPSCAPGKGRILLMDDERLVRDVAGSMLSFVGYEVVFAQDGSEALDLYEKAMLGGESFDAVIMDLTIPGGMGGKEAIRRLLDIDPQTKAIVSSGYSNDPVVASFRSYGFKGVVNKPYRIEELSRTMHEVIAEGCSP